MCHGHFLFEKVPVTSHKVPVTKFKKTCVTGTLVCHGEKNKHWALGVVLDETNLELVLNASPPFLNFLALNQGGGYLKRRSKNRL